MAPTLARVRIRSLLLLLFIVAAVGLTVAASASAHSDGCHSAHSCPSDHHTYVWYDANGQGWSCARPGSSAFDPSRDTTSITHDGNTYYCYRAGSLAPPPPPDADYDGVPDASDACPTTFATSANGCPASEPPPTPTPTPTRAYVGGFDFGDYFVLFGRPSAYKPRSVHPFSADNNAWLYRLRWRGWGRSRAYGKGRAAANNCKPSCADGRFLRKRGARVTLYRLRNGECRGKEARFYTRARLYFPRGLGLRRFAVKLTTGCGTS